MGVILNKIKLSIVVPVYNEGLGIMTFHTVISNFLAQESEIDADVIYVDDGSTDNTLALLKEINAGLPASFLSFSRNYGKEIAILAGLDQCSGDVAIIMDADLQHPPSCLPLFIDAWKNGFNVVQGIRLDTKGLSPMRKYLSELYYYFMSIVSRVQMQRNSTDFVLISRPVIDALKKFRYRRRFFRSLVAEVGFNRTFVEFIAPERSYGKTKFTVLKLISSAVDSITSTSNVPLYISFYFGVFLFFVAFFEGIYSVISKVFHITVLPGWASIVGWLSFFSGSQFIMLGLLGLYLARVFEEVKKNPLYVIKEKMSRVNRVINKNESLNEFKMSDMIDYNLIKEVAVSNESQSC